MKSSETSQSDAGVQVHLKLIFAPSGKPSLISSGHFQISTPQFCSAEISRVAIGMNIRFFATDDKSLEKNNVFVRIFNFAIFENCGVLI